ncbi:MAG: DUF58 domain-containing protein [Armatimonadetes bacterium]|nr:DUF58 domain-containing protein [Armatimonadota bacterium]
MTFTSRWLYLFAGGSALFLLSGYIPAFVALGVAFDGVLISLLIADYLLFEDPRLLLVSRRLHKRFSVTETNPVSLLFTNRGRRPVHLIARDIPPAAFHCENTIFELELAPHSEKVCRYTAVPAERGQFQFGDIYLRITGPLGLLVRQLRIPAGQQVDVYPNLQQTEKFTLLARRDRLQQMGIHVSRVKGAGREFESLRDYLPDDEYRSIDWKASARRGKLTVRQYELERSQNVILALDVGRTMLATIDGVAKLDYAVNAALMLAFVAALQDDNVGLLTFSNTIHSYVAPHRGRAQVYRILEELYDSRASLTEPEYHLAASYLRTRWRKRSLIVVFTDLWDPDSSRRTMIELAAMQPQHLVCCVTAMDTNVLRAVDAEPQVPDDVYQKGVALQVIADRELALAALRQRGILVVDAPAHQLSASLVNRYLEIKRRGLL